MGFASMESGVLKLVYPRGVVEVHKEPITAAEVMKRNPRHCVTRPDVFRFPWLVVRPESVLKLGRVFFIVPYHTIYRLIRSKEHPDQQNQYLCPNRKVTSPISNCKNKLDSTDFSTELVQFHRVFQKMSLDESNKAKTKFEDGPTGCFGSKFRKTRPLLSSVKHEGVHGLLNTSEQISELRSCLKKEKTSSGQSRSFKVRFALDHEDDKKRI